MRQQVVFTANNRPHYMLEAMESWSRVRGVGDAHFDFHCEPDCPQMIEACSTAMDFTTVTMHVNQSQFGVQRNPYEAIKCGFSRGADFVILAEDDLIVSSDVLEYFAWARDRYCSDRDVIAVSAFQHHRLPCGSAAVRRTANFCCWVWGTWVDRWDSKLEPDWTFNYEHRGWDWRITDYWVKTQGMRVISPDESRSLHIGQFGGTHMRPNEFDSQSSDCFTFDVPRQEYTEVLKMNDVTLIVLAWHRPDYLQRCLASWAQARGVDGLLAVTVRCGRSDSNMEERNRLVAEGAGLPNVRFVLDDPEDASIKGPDMALGKEFAASFRNPYCGFAIECDEDVLVSDDILEYFSWSRQLGPDAVCAHSSLGQGWLPWYDDSGADQAAVHLRGEFTSWCFGMSRESWHHVWLPEWDWTRTSGSDPNQHGFEWQMHRQACSGLELAIPDASRCQNIGEHGGTFSSPEGFAGTQAGSYRPHRGQVKYRLV